MIEPNDKFWSGDEFDGLYGPTGVPLVTHPMQGLSTDPLAEALARIKELKENLRELKSAYEAAEKSFLDAQDRIRDENTASQGLVLTGLRDAKRQAAREHSDLFTAAKAWAEMNGEGHAPDHIPDASKMVCPRCGGPADNGFDRCLPPNPYNCTKCEGKEGAE